MSIILAMMVVSSECLKLGRTGTCTFISTFPWILALGSVHILSSETYDMCNSEIASTAAFASASASASASTSAWACDSAVRCGAVRCGGGGEGEREGGGERASWTRIDAVGAFANGQNARPFEMRHTSEAYVQYPIGIASFVLILVRFAF